MIVGAHTCDGVPFFVENARSLGVDEIEFQKLVLMGHPEFFARNNLFQRKYADKLFRLWRDLEAIEFRSNRNEIIGIIDAYLNHLGFRGMREHVEQQNTLSNEIVYEIPARDIKPESGRCWIAPLPSLGTPDDLSHSAISELQLFENEKLLC